LDDRSGGIDLMGVNGHHVFLLGSIANRLPEFVHYDELASWLLAFEESAPWQPITMIEFLTPLFKSGSLATIGFLTPPVR
jgi:hypothetical protein